MPSYIGITLGPIYDTLTSVRKPASLWGASYMFSMFARKLCEYLSQKEIDSFVTPYFEPHNIQIMAQKYPGIGLFHDRIVFQAKPGDLAKVKAAIEHLKLDISQALNYDLNLDENQHIQQMQGNGDDFYQDICHFVQDYLQFYAVELEVPAKENPILFLSPYLDALELEKSFLQQERSNYFLSLLENDNIKQSFLIRDCGGLTNLSIAVPGEGRLKQIEEIALGNLMTATMKKHCYYAIIQADGDNMGKILSALKEDKEIVAFSKTCFAYASEASSLIHNFGAITLYAGGDDLLILSSLENKNQKTIFDLLTNIEVVFQRHFKKYEEYKPSISFGVSINYAKFPLYESFQRASQLLFGIAKQTKHKNATAVQIQKHAGTNFGFVLEQTAHNQTYKTFKEILGLYGKIAENHTEQFLQSIMLKLEQFKPLFVHAIEEYMARLPEHIEENQKTILHHVFDNMFDHPIHQTNQKFIKAVVQLMEEVICHKDIRVCNQNMSNQNPDKAENVIQCMISLLRTLKFFAEKGLEERYRR